MNYNEYDSNGNKKNFDFDMSDKKTRARVILGIYAVLFIVLIIFIRTSGIKYNNQANNEVNGNTETNTIEEPDIEVDGADYSLIDNNNYEFKIVASYEGKEYGTLGKRYGDKFSFDYGFDGTVYKFLGTIDSIKVLNPETNGYVKADFPYFYFNYYNNSVIKKILSNSKYIDGKFQINNISLSNITGNKIENPKDEMNTFELVVKNGYVVGLEIDITNVVDNTLNSSSVAKISIEYSNFGLVEDFSIETE